MVGIERSGSISPSGPPKAAPAGNPATGASVGAPPPVGGAAILPPMPGKVIEVKVREGERVKRGQPLLILEAMKMRNEVVAPHDGVVQKLVAQPGANARAREPMLYVVPDGGGASS